MFKGIIDLNEKGGRFLKKKGFILIRYILFVILTLIVCGSLIGGGVSTYKNFKTKELIAQCDVIDRTLESWVKNHNSVDIESISYRDDGKMLYKKRSLYPRNLIELGQVQDMGYYVKNIDLSKFNYYSFDNGTKYKLEVILPDGSVYTSSKSK